MRLCLAPAVAAAALLLALPAAPGRAAEPCAEATTTLEVRSCLAQRLVEADRRLSTALLNVKRQALAEPSAAFRSGWSELIDGLAGGTDPAVQLQRFQEERRRICLYSQSLSFQGSGYGAFVSGCELALTETLLRQLQDQ